MFGNETVTPRLASLEGNLSYRNLSCRKWLMAEAENHPFSMIVTLQALLHAKLFQYTSILSSHWTHFPIKSRSLVGLMEGEHLLQFLSWFASASIRNWQNWRFRLTGHLITTDCSQPIIVVFVCFRNMYSITTAQSQPASHHWLWLDTCFVLHVVLRLKDIDNKKLITATSTHGGTGVLKLFETFVLAHTYRHALHMYTFHIESLTMPDF